MPGLTDYLTSSMIFSIDSLLKGGVYTGELTEIWGPTASGKTQVQVYDTSHAHNHTLLCVQTAVSPID